LSTPKTSPNEPPVAPKKPVSEVELLSRAEHPDPFHILGPHLTGEGDAKRLVVRAFLPKASEASVILEGHANPIPAWRISPEGLFEAALPLAPVLPISPSSYRWRVSEAGRVVHEDYDSYAFPALLSDYDLHLMGEGTHYLKYEKMGAHPTTVLGIAGVQFAVWAPNAMRASVVGDFNQWDGRAHPMRNRGPSGVWELFVPELAEGAIYKYEIRPMSADLPILKSDPYGFYSELSAGSRPSIRRRACGFLLSPPACAPGAGARRHAGKLRPRANSNRESRARLPDAEAARRREHGRSKAPARGE